MLRYCLTENIKLLIKDKKVSFGKSYECGIPASTLHDWSMGVAPVLSQKTIDRVCKIAQYVGVNPLYLLFGDSLDADFSDLKHQINDEAKA